MGPVIGLISTVARGGYPSEIDDYKITLSGDMLDPRTSSLSLFFAFYQRQRNKNSKVAHLK